MSYYSDQELKRIADALEKIVDALGKDTDVPTTDAATEEPKCENCKYFDEVMWRDPMEVFPKLKAKRICNRPLARRELIDGEEPCDYFERR